MTMTKMINWRNATIRLWMLSIAFLGISLANVSCTSAEDEPSGQIREEGFFTSEVNTLIDANYPEVVANGYAELIIPSTMFDPGIMKYADYHKDVMVALNRLGYKTYINGGAVRDAIMGTAIHDLDFSTDASPEEMKEQLTGYEVVINTTSGGSVAKAYHPNGDWTDMVPIKGVNERLRGKPFVPADATYATYSKRLVDDTYTRDLTINSIYYDFQNNTIIDYHGGLHDLRDRVVRTVYDANTMYAINASALIRTVRFAARYGFDIDAATTTAIADNMHYCRETISGAMNNYYICKGFGDGCVRRTYEYYRKYGIADYFMLGLKGYIGTDAYEEPMLKALDYIESKTKVTLELAMSAMYLPVMKARLADKERTLEAITAVWDELETTSGQREVYEINDYYMERTAMLNIWYVYFALTGSPLSTEALENLKQNSYYAKGELLVEAYQ